MVGVLPDDQGLWKREDFAPLDVKVFLIPMGKQDPGMVRAAGDMRRNLEGMEFGSECLG